MREVFSSGDDVAVAVAKSVLEAAGIAYEIRNDSVSQVMIGAPFYAELWVGDENYAAASELLAAARESS